MASTNHYGDLSVSQSVTETEEFALKKAELECEERLRREDMERPYGGFVREREKKHLTVEEIMEIKKRTPKKLSPLQKLLAERKAAKEWPGDETPLPPADAPKFADEEDDYCPKCGEFVLVGDEDDYCSDACSPWRTAVAGGETPRAHEMPEAPSGLHPTAAAGGGTTAALEQFKHEIAVGETVKRVLDSICDEYRGIACYKCQKTDGCYCWMETGPTDEEVANAYKQVTGAEYNVSNMTPRDMTRPAICGTCEVESCTCAPVRDVTWSLSK